MIILDTNVLSELVRANPEHAVQTWIAAQPVPTLFTTSTTQAEMLLGVALLAQGKRRAELDVAINRLFDVGFSGRVLPFDSSAARAFADLVAKRRRAGRPIAQHDAQIAAIARSRDASLATRNTADFQGCGLDVVNPWEA